MAVDAVFGKLDLLAGISGIVGGFEHFDGGFWLVHEQLTQPIDISRHRVDYDQPAGGNWCQFDLINRTDTVPYRHGNRCVPRPTRRRASVIKLTTRMCRASSLIKGEPLSRFPRSVAGAPTARRRCDVHEWTDARKLAKCCHKVSFCLTRETPSRTASALHISFRHRDIRSELTLFGGSKSVVAQVRRKTTGNFRRCSLLFLTAASSLRCRLLQ